MYTGGVFDVYMYFFNLQIQLFPPFSLFLPHPISSGDSRMIISYGASCPPMSIDTDPQSFRNSSSYPPYPPSASPAPAPSLSHAPNSNDQSPSTSPALSSSSSPSCSPCPELDHSKFIYLRQVGKGACGEVWLSTYEGERMAVKRVFRSLLSEDTFQDFMREVRGSRRKNRDRDKDEV